MQILPVSKFAPATMRTLSLAALVLSLATLPAPSFAQKKDTKTAKPVAAVAPAAEKFTLVYKAEVGRTRRTRGTYNLVLDLGGQKLMQEVRFVERTTYTKVEPNGNITTEGVTESRETYVNGRKVNVPESKDDPSVQTFRPDGTLVAFKSGSKQEDKDHVSARLAVATNVIFSDKPVGVGDTWTHEYKADPALGTLDAKATFEVLGVEKIDTIDAVKIKMVYTESGTKPITVTQTAWVEKLSGDTLRDEVAVENLPTGQPQVPYANAQVKSERSEGGPLIASQTKGGAKSNLRPYAEVITKEAKTTDGLFKTHLIDDKLYFEIPKAQLGKELLWVTTFARTQVGYGFGGTEVQNRVVRWERRGEKILLRGVDYQVRSRADGAIRKSIELASVEPILMTFDMKAVGPNDAPVIDASPILLTDVQEFSPSRQLGGARLDTGRSFIEKAKAFPNNIELNVLSTYVGGGGPGRGGFGGGPGPSRDPSTSAITIVLHHTIVTLPEKPMKPRIEDSRVGFFSTDFYDFGTPDNRVKDTTYIDRWRLEKKDPTAALSEPVKPIVYYMGPEVPEQWRPYIKKGVEAWQAAFEKAGFKNAILCKESPSAKEDPDFDPDDARYSVIRWLPATIENAYGPHIVDPRTGEILNADIKIFHDVLKLAENWYFSQASPNDPRGRRLPLPVDLEGQLLQYIVCHEVGHTLGFPHNKKASSSYTIKQLRDPNWTALWGDEASIMDYGRFNYVAQPGDHATLIPKLGPYDLFAVEWGYKPIDSPTPEGEKPTLDALAAQQVKNPMLRFGHGEEDATSREDPQQRSEDLGDDAIAASTLGLKNLERVFSYIVPATTKFGEDYDRLNEMLDVVLDQRITEVSHVAALIGGFTQTNWHAGRGDVVYTPIPAARQKAAMVWLQANVFTTPKMILRPEILQRVESSGIEQRVLRDQLYVLATLMTASRVQRLLDQEGMPRAATSAVPYTLAQMMEDIRHGIWSELGNRSVVIDLYRRNLQRAYLTLVSTRLTTGGISDMRPLSRAALVDTKASIQAALSHTTDLATRRHLQDCLVTISQTLDPRRPNGSDGPGNALAPYLQLMDATGGKDDVEAFKKAGCWSLPPLVPQTNAGSLKR